MSVFSLCRCDVRNSCFLFPSRRKGLKMLRNITATCFTIAKCSTWRVAMAGRCDMSSLKRLLGRNSHRPTCLTHHGICPSQRMPVRVAPVPEAFRMATTRTHPVAVFSKSKGRITMNNINPIKMVRKFGTTLRRWNIEAAHQCPTQLMVGPLVRVPCSLSGDSSIHCSRSDFCSPLPVVDANNKSSNAFSLSVCDLCPGGFFADSASLSAHTHRPTDRLRQFSVLHL